MTSMKASQVQKRRNGLPPPIPRKKRCDRIPLASTPMKKNENVRLGSPGVSAFIQTPHGVSKYKRNFQASTLLKEDKDSKRATNDAENIKDNFASTPMQQRRSVRLGSPGVSVLIHTSHNYEKIKGNFHASTFSKDEHIHSNAENIKPNYASTPIKQRRNIPLESLGVSGFINSALELRGVRGNFHASDLLKNKIETSTELSQKPPSGDSDNKTLCLKNVRTAMPCTVNLHHKKISPAKVCTKEVSRKNKARIRDRKKVQIEKRALRTNLSPSDVKLRNKDAAVKKIPIKKLPLAESRGEELSEEKKRTENPCPEKVVIENASPSKLRASSPQVIKSRTKAVPAKKLRIQKPRLVKGLDDKSTTAVAGIENPYQPKAVSENDSPRTLRSKVSSDAILRIQGADVKKIQSSSAADKQGEKSFTAVPAIKSLCPENVIENVFPIILRNTCSSDVKLPIQRATTRKKRIKKPSLAEALPEKLSEETAAVTNPFPEKRVIENAFLNAFHTKSQLEMCIEESQVLKLLKTNLKVYPGKSSRKEFCSVQQTPATLLIEKPSPENVRPENLNVYMPKPIRKTKTKKKPIKRSPVVDRSKKLSAEKVGIENPFAEKVVIENSSGASQSKYLLDVILEIKPAAKKIQIEKPSTAQVVVNVGIEKPSPENLLTEKPSPVEVYMPKLIQTFTAVKKQIKKPSRAEDKSQKLIGVENPFTGKVVIENTSTGTSQSKIPFDENLAIKPSTKKIRIQKLSTAQVVIGKPFPENLHAEKPPPVDVYMLKPIQKAVKKRINKPSRVEHRPKELKVGIENSFVGNIVTGNSSLGTLQSKNPLDANLERRPAGKKMRIQKSSTAQVVIEKPSSENANTGKKPPVEVYMPKPIQIVSEKRINKPSRVEDRHEGLKVGVVNLFTGNVEIENGSTGTLKSESPLHKNLKVKPARKKIRIQKPSKAQVVIEKPFPENVNTENPPSAEVNRPKIIQTVSTAKKPIEPSRLEDRPEELKTNVEHSFPGKAVIENTSSSDLHTSDQLEDMYIEESAVLKLINKPKLKVYLGKSTRKEFHTKHSAPEEGKPLLQNEKIEKPPPVEEDVPKSRSEMLVEESPLLKINNPILKVYPAKSSQKKCSSKQAARENVQIEKLVSTESGSNTCQQKTSSEIPFSLKLLAAKPFSESGLHRDNLGSVRICNTTQSPQHKSLSKDRKVVNPKLDSYEKQTSKERITKISPGFMNIKQPTKRATAGQGMPSCHSKIFVPEDSLELRRIADPAPNVLKKFVEHQKGNEYGDFNKPRRVYSSKNKLKTESYPAKKKPKRLVIESSDSE